MRRLDAAAITTAFAITMLPLLLGGCSETKGDPKAEAPPQTTVEREQDVSVVQTDHLERFPLVAAVDHTSATQLVATGTVSPDVSRTVPVISLAAGRVVEVRARLGDTVKKGQLLLRVQSADMSGAFSDYRKAVADEQLARTQLDRSKLLYDRGAISLNDLQVSEDAEAKAKVDLENTAERLRVLGGNIDHPASIVDIVAPISGVITDQQVTAAAGVQGLSDLANVHVGETAEIRINAYPDTVLTGRINNVGPVLDPSIRTAKVRIELHNPGLLRVGMFANATFHGQKKETHAAVPASAILHLHDRDWVYVPAGDLKFRRVGVVAGAMLPNNMQEILAGIKPGQQVVQNALELQNTVEQ
jgi:cobalt-zinc-cadmium efflux system membrane fusion protein